MGREIPILVSTGSGSWGASLAKTISGGIFTASRIGIYVVSPESGVADSLTRIIGSGLNVGDEIILSPENGTTITVTKGTYFKMPGDCVLDNQYDELRLRYLGSDVFREVVRVSNS